MGHNCVLAASTGINLIWAPVNEIYLTHYGHPGAEKVAIDDTASTKDGLDDASLPGDSVRGSSIRGGSVVAGDLEVSLHLQYALSHFPLAFPLQDLLRPLVHLSTRQRERMVLRVTLLGRQMCHCDDCQGALHLPK